jgi:hypothetical protein
MGITLVDSDRNEAEHAFNGNPNSPNLLLPHELNKVYSGFGV